MKRGKENGKVPDNYNWSESLFNKVFDEVDKDNNGYIDANEISGFADELRRALLSEVKEKTCDL